VGTLASSMTETSRSTLWFWEFLKGELAPFPGRAAIVARLVLAATLVMIICETFRIPTAFQGAIYALLISRESTQATVRAAVTMFVVTLIGAAYLLISVYFVISVPSLHFFWNITSFFLVFYAISVLTDYSAAIFFAVVVSSGVPFWDRHVPAETNVESTLWILGVVLIGASVTAALELAFARRSPGENAILGIAARLAAVQSVLISCAEGRAPDRATENNVTRLRGRGTSSLRRLLLRSGFALRYNAQMSGVVSLTGRLVDLAATLTQIRSESSRTIQTQARDVAAAIGSIRDDLINKRVPGPVQFDTDDEASLQASLLGEMEDTVSLIPPAFAGSRSIDEDEVSADDLPEPKLIAKDALTNPDHFKFALRGCFAAGGAYIIYNAIDWQGISTSVVTCLLTALSTIGVSRQKQVLRLAGVVLGGLVIGMGAQIFVLPYLDSITGFLVLFVSVTFLSAWIMTCTPRLSYMGLQIALAFYLINLQEFAPQTSLAVARDRVVGTLFGLFMMWLAFDHLWATPAAVGMKTTFVSAIRTLAHLTREPSSSDIEVAIKRSHSLCATINAQFDNIRALADGVLFEFGPSRQQGLALRERIRRWQPQLRTLFLMRRASLRYSLGLPGFELPEAARLALREYNERSAHMLDEMANRIEGGVYERTLEPEDGEQFLEQVLATCGASESRALPPHLRSFVVLLRRIDGVTRSVAEDIRAGYA
jgi:multidrug resistance protein MdtO